MRVGIIGGGQLAWMMAAAVDKLDLELLIQTPSKDDPAVSVADQIILAPVADALATHDLAQHCDVISFENEFVDLDALAKIKRVPFFPQLKSLRPLLDKLDQRSYFQQLGLPTPHFVELVYDGQTPIAPPIPGFPAVLKTRRHGYDGQGTFILHSAAEWAAALDQCVGIPLVQEAFVPFQHELAVMAARSRSGEVALYPVVETVQNNQVCQRVYVPAQVDRAVERQVHAIAQTLLSNLDYVGILGIELFLTTEGQVWVNEIAPRTHNSGHYTLDACTTSQFEQQLRVVTGKPLGPVGLIAPAVMVNLLGYETATDEYREQRRAIAALPNAHLYWYGKAQSRPGRKLGHVTILLEAASVLEPSASISADETHRTQLKALADQVESIWYPN
jgi:5-(carboxyamino)imidazole ribonucleotide synthase